MKKVWSAIGGYIGMTDKWLSLFWLAASGLSVFFLYGLYVAELVYTEARVVTQLAAIGAGLVCAVIISLIDYHFLLKLWKLYTPLCVIFVLSTLFVGTVRGDNQAWLLFDIGSHSFSVQPSEFLKISFITTMAVHLDKVRESMNRIVHLLLLGLHGAAHVLLIHLQGDDGNAIIFLCIFVVMLFFSGINWRYLILAGAGAVVMLPILWFKIMTDDQKMRFLILANPELDAAYAYQQEQGKLALGVGGLQGTGIFADRHVRVPEMYNDFIFTFIGEATGFMGCLAVIVLLTLIMFKLLYNSSIAGDHMGKCVCVGVFAMILTQTAINLGMCIGIMPVIGVTLPLLSSGGSSVLSLYMGLGLVLSVYIHAPAGLFYGRS